MRFLLYRKMILRQNLIWLFFFQVLYSKPNQLRLQRDYNFSMYLWLMDFSPQVITCIFSISLFITNNSKPFLKISISLLSLNSRYEYKTWFIYLRSMHKIHMYPEGICSFNSSNNDSGYHYYKEKRFQKVKRVWE